MKSVLITGGNSGLGFECARALAAAGDWHVVIAARDAAKSAQAARAIRAESGADRVEALMLDLASLQAIREFTRRFATGDRPPLRALVCNAGVQLPVLGARTVEGFEQTFGVNHLGHFLLTRLLLPRLVTPARIVVVSSAGHDPARRTGLPPPRLRAARSLALPELDVQPDTDLVTAARRAYATSKLCNVLFVRELARRLEARGVQVGVEAFDPGFMPATALGRDMGPASRFFFARVLAPLSRIVPGLVRPQEAAAHLAQRVSDPAFTGTAGRYFTPRGEATPSAEAQDAAKAAALWRESSVLVGLEPDEKLHAAGRALSGP